MFLKGTMKLTEFCQTGSDSGLLKLLCGESSDSYGNIVPAEDRWEREVGTPNLIYSPGSLAGTPTNISGLSMRAEYQGNGDGNDKNEYVWFRCQYFKGGSSWSDQENFPPRLYFAFDPDGAPTVTPSTDSVQYFISVTKDRIIITTLGAWTNPSSTNLTSTLYIGTFKTFMPRDVDLYPMVSAGTHNDVYLMYGHQQGSTTSCNSLNVGCQDSSIDWARRGLEDTAKLIHLGEDNYANIRPEIGDWASQTYTREDPNSWSGKWYLYPIFIAGGKEISSSDGGDYPDVATGWRGRLLDIYALNITSPYTGVDFSNLDILQDNSTSYRLILPTDIYYSYLGTLRAQFGNSFRSALVMRQR